MSLGRTAVRLSDRVLHIEPWRACKERVSCAAGNADARQMKEIVEKNLRRDTMVYVVVRK